MEKPEKPLPSDCCGQGCTPCVYELYTRQMVMYENWLAENKNVSKEQSQEETADGNGPDSEMG